MNIFSKYNNGNVIILATANTGSTSIMMKLIDESLERKEKIYLIDAEYELSYVYKKEIPNFIHFVSKKAKMEKFLEKIEEGSTIFIDRFSLYSEEIKELINKMFDSKKYRFVIVADTPRDVREMWRYDNIIALTTNINYTRFFWHETAYLKLGEALINKDKEPVKFPVEEWMLEKMNRCKKAHKQEH